MGARFFQVESRLSKLVELTVASEIPLVYQLAAVTAPRSQGQVLNRVARFKI